jgi:alpha-methylacyl-CoA racemase
VLPLSDIEVLDFSTLLPGPMATLILAEAGASVTKVERPGVGDEMRAYAPRFGDASVNFALLNRGKHSLEIDLKAPGAAERLRPRLERADVLVEQFRPGVMDRFGLGYEAVAAINPGIVYCSLTGYGQAGPRARTAAHDLNYVAETGLLDLVGGEGGEPVLPPALVADIGGGAYPAVINILLALAERRRSGCGAHLDVAMADNVFPFLYWALGAGHSAGRWPGRGTELLTGGSPRYRLYRTADDRFVAAAPLEDRFWERFCTLVGLEGPLRDDARDPLATAAAVAERIAAQPAAHWRERFQDTDVCCSLVQSVEEAVADEHFRARGIFARRVVDGEGVSMPALPVPVADAFRRPEEQLSFPALGESAREPG